MAHQSVRGVCPSCGTALLFLAEGGYITCSLHDCPDPTAADRLLYHSRQVVRALTMCHAARDVIADDKERV
jgi:hypothetical protein